MTTYSIREFKARVSEILRDLDDGAEEIITRRGKPWRQAHSCRGTHRGKTFPQHVEGLPVPPARCDL